MFCYSLFKFPFCAVAQVGGTTQQNAVLTFVNVEVSTDETALAFAAMARDYGAGSKKLKSPDNLLLQVLRTSLGGNAHSVAIAALLPGMSPATTELVVKVSESTPRTVAACLLHCPEQWLAADIV